MWVPSALCTTDSCNQHNKFQYETSSTYQVSAHTPHQACRVPLQHKYWSLRNTHGHWANFATTKERYPLMTVAFCDHGILPGRPELCSCM